MAANYDRISSIVSNRECIRLLVRVVRLWTVPLFNNPAHASSLEMLLIDERGGRIQATVRKPLLHRFSSLLEEGCCYKIVYFNVVPNSGGYRASTHDFKLVFLFKTTVVRKKDPSIPLFGLNCIPFGEILNYNDNHEYLIDVIGLLTVVFPERQYLINGKTTTMVVIELTDPSGKLECALFG